MAHGECAVPKYMVLAIGVIINRRLPISLGPEQRRHDALRLLEVSLPVRRRVIRARDSGLEFRRVRRVVSPRGRPPLGGGEIRVGGV